MRKLLLIATLLVAGCAESMTPTAEYTIDSAVYTALTAEKVVLSRPCTAKVTDVCTTPELAKILRDSRILLMAALMDYHVARDEYLDAIEEGRPTNEAALAAAQAAVRKAITQANSVLALEIVQQIIAKVEG